MSRVKITFSVFSWAILFVYFNVCLHLFWTDHQAVRILWLFKTIHVLEVMFKIYVWVFFAVCLVTTWKGIIIWNAWIFLGQTLTKNGTSKNVSKYFDTNGHFSL